MRTLDRPVGLGLAARGDIDDVVDWARQARDILLLGLRPGAILLFGGTVIGLGASIFVTRLMSSLLFGVSANDPFTFAIVPLLLGMVAMGACLVPARYATRVSPAEALRTN